MKYFKLNKNVMTIFKSAFNTEKEGFDLIDKVGDQLAEEANKAVANGSDGQISLVVEAVMDRLSDEEKEKLLFIHLCDRTVKMTHCDCPSCQARRAEFRQTGEFRTGKSNGKGKYEC